MKSAFFAAFRGLRVGWIAERHIKIHSAATAVVLGLAWYSGLDGLRWSILILCIGAVLGAEYMNSAIERLADRVTRDRDPLIRDAKDLAAAAVLAVSIGAALVGSIILGPALWFRIFGA